MEIEVEKRKIKDLPKPSQAWKRDSGFLVDGYWLLKVPKEKEHDDDYV